MPSQKNLQTVDLLADKLKSAKSAALLQYQGLNAGDISKLRSDIKDQGGIMEVAKNSLIQRALEKIGIKMDSDLTGPTAIAFAQEDEVAPLKVVSELAKTKEQIVFKMGLFEGKALSVADLKTVLSLPSKSALFAQLLGAFTNPLSRLVYAGKYQQTRLALTLKALADKKATA